jgi:hypothetical protein
MSAKTIMSGVTAVLAVALVVVCLISSGSALEDVRTAMASGLMLLVTVVGVLVYLVGAALRIFRGAGATLYFAVATVLFLVSAWMWRYSTDIRGLSIFGAIISAGGILEPYLAKSRA